MPRLLLIDNYDSFTYNLFQYLGELGAEVEVRRNDRISLEQLQALEVDGVVISPGPGSPSQARLSLELPRRLPSWRPALGVCLGHQCLGEAFGGRVVRAPELRHGKTSEVWHDGKGIFRDLPNPLVAVRYHSLIVERESLPDCLEVSATTADGLVMGLRHKQYPLEGVQFHPESILTQAGKQLLGNFLVAVEACATSRKESGIRGD